MNKSPNLQEAFKKSLPSITLIISFLFLSFSIYLVVGFYKNTNKPDAYLQFVQKNALEEFKKPECKNLVNRIDFVVTDETYVSSNQNCSALLSILSVLKRNQFQNSREGDLITDRDIYMTLKKIEDTGWKTAVFLDAIYFSILVSFGLWICTFIFNLTKYFFWK